MKASARRMKVCMKSRKGRIGRKVGMIESTLCRGVIVDCQCSNAVLDLLVGVF